MPELPQPHISRHGEQQEPGAPAPGRDAAAGKEGNCCDVALERGLGAKGEDKEQENAASKDIYLREKLRSTRSGHRSFPSESHS